MSNKDRERILSASRIKTLETCTWSYWCNYHLKVPQRQNEGALRGTIAHLVFEILLNPRHRHHYDAIVLGGSIGNSPAVARLVLKKLQFDTRKHDLPMDSQSNYELMDKMIVLGLCHDYFCKGGKIDKPEYEFLIDNNSPKYKIRGFIDKPAVYEKEKVVKIIDYKSSKNKFSQKELSSSMQGMAYSLAAKREWPDYKPIVEFLFLRFPRSPTQKVEFSDEDLEGFEYYLEHCFSIINNYTEEVAVSRFAADYDEDKWMCKIGSWKCPYLEPYDYYCLVDKDGEVLSKSFKEDFDVKEGQKVVKEKYNGCPRHFVPRQARASGDPFGGISENPNCSGSDPFNF
jgi:hypothetical protein